MWTTTCWLPILERIIVISFRTTNYLNSQRRRNIRMPSQKFPLHTHSALPFFLLTYYKKAFTQVQLLDSIWIYREYKTKRTSKSCVYCRAMELVWISSRNKNQLIGVHPHPQSHQREKTKTWTWSRKALVIIPHFFSQHLHVCRTTASSPSPLHFVPSYIAGRLQNKAFHVVVVFII